MAIENLNIDEITGARRKAVEESIETISVEKLKALGEELFPFHDHPWREKFFGFITENADVTFYHATTNDHFHIVYCNARGRGIWYLPGSGMGPMQQNGLNILKQIVESRG
jgi:hypothetical protein